MAEARHLKRLNRIWIHEPVYFITTCVSQRRPILANEQSHQIIRNEFGALRLKHHWSVGPYVIMPDHVHFFAKPNPGSSKPMSKAIGLWKQWTAKRILQNTHEPSPLWQPEFFDHLLRSSESRRAKWDYISNNPVRAGLVKNAADWPFAGHVDFR